jgi:hypothetical protein
LFDWNEIGRFFGIFKHRDTKIDKIKVGLHFWQFRESIGGNFFSKKHLATREIWPKKGYAKFWVLLGGRWATF